MANKGSDGPKRHFTISLEPDISLQVHNFMQENGISSRSQTVNTLVRMALAATPEHGMQSADRARAYNEIRIWSMNQTAQAHRDIAKLLESMMGVMK